MAATFVIMASLMGFTAGSVGFLAYDLPFLASLALWLGAGPVSAALMLLRPQRRVAMLRQTA